jgi:hypothetical protein
MYYLIGLLILGIIAAIPPAFRGVCQYFIAPFFTPRGHVLFGDYHETEAFRSLQRDGYDVEPLWASDAVGSIEKT